MNLKRTLTIGAAGGALAAWFAAAATIGRGDRPRPVSSQSAPIDRRGADLASEVERLHERLRPTASPRQPARNLFDFGKPPRSVAAPAAHAAALTEAAPAVPIAPPAPAFKLEGIAEDADADGAPVRTAIISVPGQLLLVKEGESVIARYRVARISPDGVELVDLQDNSTLRLVLK